MVTPLTLWDAIRPHEKTFEAAVFECVKEGLVALGDDIYRMEWANATIAVEIGTEPVKRVAQAG